MKVLITMVFLFNSAWAMGGDVNRKICVAGLERLVILSNAETVTGEELDEAALIADTLLRNKCYEYFVDRRGTVYAGASLSYLFGRICGIKKDTAAINAYIHYLDSNTDSTTAEEVDYALEELFHAMPQLFVEHRLSDSTFHYLLPRIAWGFLNNVYTTYGALTVADYKDVFYKRYPMLKPVDGSKSKTTKQLLVEIEGIVR
jgi:hypothetical protein